MVSCRYVGARTNGRAQMTSTAPPVKQTEAPVIERSRGEPGGSGPVPPIKLGALEQLHRPLAVLDRMQRGNPKLQPPPSLQHTGPKTVRCYW